MLEVRPCTMEEVFAVPHLDMMIAEHESECANPAMPPIHGKLEYYKFLQDRGVLHPFGAWICGYFIGFCGVMVPVLPHYSRIIAVTETIFVTKEFRNTGAGLRLLRMAKKKAVELGSPGMLVSAPLVGELDRLLTADGFSPWSVSWYKSFSKPQVKLPKMSAEDIARVSDFESEAVKQPQVPLVTEQSLHAGVYRRTVLIPAGVVITGALIRVPTTVIVNGDVTVYVGDEIIRLNGHAVLSADADRKQIFEAHTDTYLTMIFATEAISVEEAEEEFTDEVDLLQTRQLALSFSSGEQQCLASQPQPSSPA